MVKIVVGLGNPGSNFVNTRHNLGFEFVEYLASEFCSDNFKEKNGCLFLECFVGKNKLVFLKPQTYMNNSGFAVSSFVNYFNINNDDVLIIYDDINLSVGSLRFRKRGSSGGHKGIKSIIELLRSDSFCRIKIGIGYDKDVPLNDWVLGKISVQEKEKIFPLREKVKEVFLKWLSGR